MALSLYKHNQYGTLSYEQVDSNWSQIESDVNGLSSRLPLNNYNATTDPTVNDDVTQGYSVGSYWFNRTTDTLFVNTNANSGAANWVEQSSVAGSFGSGAYADVISSPTDTTAGRLLTVGAGGWLVDDAAVGLAPGDNLNTLRISGLWRFASSTTGAPSGVSAGMVLHITRLGGEGVHRHTQIAYNADSEFTTMKRTMASDGSWENWALQYDQNSILGTVSQSGGVPTGALMEYGSNANGEFFKYAGGMMICQRVEDIDMTSSTGVPLDHPSLFSERPSFVGISPKTVSGDWQLVKDIAISTNSTAWYFQVQTTGSNTEQSCGLTAIGRWF